MPVCQASQPHPRLPAMSFRGARMRDGRPGLLIRFAAIAVAAILLAVPATAQEALKGVALVIGQSEYQGLAPLKTPENDARALDDLLDGLGFDVSRVLDADAE